jgi:hypothetical protein
MISFCLGYLQKAVVNNIFSGKLDFSRVKLTKL